MVIENYLTNEWLLHHLPSNSTILDIGCNDGHNSIEFSRLFPDSMIFSFDPEQRALDVFKSRGIPSNVKLFEYALSNKNGLDIFWQCSGFEPNRPGQREADWSGSLLKPKVHLDAVPWMKFDKTSEVYTQTLDSWILANNVNFIDFIWMDVQGAEHLVFEGAQNSLHKINYIHTEFDDRELYSGQKTLNELMKYLPDFEIIKKFDFDVLLKNKTIK